MKFKTYYLFYFLFVVAIGLLFITGNSTTELMVHDSYFIMDHFYFLSSVAGLSLLTAITYAVFEKIKKPVKTKTSIIHFIFILLGLLFSLNIYRLIMTFIMLDGIPDTISFAYETTSLIGILLGPTFLLAGSIVFTTGLVRAFLQSKTVHA